MFDIVQMFLWVILFDSLKYVMNMNVLFFLGTINHGVAHSESVLPILRTSRYYKIDNYCINVVI